MNRERELLEKKHVENILRMFDSLLEDRVNLFEKEFPPADYSDGNPIISGVGTKKEIGKRLGKIYDMAYQTPQKKRRGSLPRHYYKKQKKLDNLMKWHVLLEEAEKTPMLSDWHGFVFPQEIEVGLTPKEACEEYEKRFGKKVQRPNMQNLLDLLVEKGLLEKKPGWFTVKQLKYCRPISEYNLFLKNILIRKNFSKKFINNTKANYFQMANTIYNAKFWANWEQLHPETFRHLLDDLEAYQAWKTKQKEVNKK